MTRLISLLAIAALFGAACGTAETDTATGDVPANNDSGDSDADGSDGEGGDGETTPTSTDAGLPASSADGGDDDDAVEILGNPDLDTDALPDEVAEALDDIDDVVSIGDCSSDVVGLAVTAPDGWQCRVLDQPVGGIDGFTLFTEGNDLNITIGTPSPIGSPCEALQMCGDASAVSWSDNFPDTMQLSLAGTVMAWGTHSVLDAELVVTKASALTDAEVELISTVLDSAVAI